MKLTEISDDLCALDDLLEEVVGDVSGNEETIATWVAELTANLAAKLDGYADLIGAMQARADFRKQESKRLADRARIDEKKVAWLKARVIDAMNRTGNPVVESDRYRISVARNGGVRPMELIGEVPTNFCKTEVVQSPDREAIRASLEAGEYLPFARLMPRGERLVIK